MNIDLQDKVALVTGANGTLGGWICTYLADAGCRLLAADLNFEPERAAQLEAARACLLRFDVADFAATEAAFAEGEAALGPADILVNVAGITRDMTLKKMTPEHWQSVIDTNLTGIFNCTRNATVGMSERGWGRIINISSVNGQTGQFGQANYSAAKAGVHGFTMAVAREVARKGVTVNTISPGYIDSPMMNAIPADVRKTIEQGIPIGRFGQPQDIATMATFLASEQAAWITGADFSVNGGQHMG